MPPPWKEHSDACQAALDRRNRVVARGHLEAAFAVAADRPLKLRLQEADLLLLESDAERAGAVLAETALAYPCSFWPELKHAALNLRYGDLVGARRHLDLCRARDPEGCEPHATRLEAEIARASGDPTALAASVAALQRRSPTDPRLLAQRLALAHLYALADRVADEEVQLVQLATEAPTNPLVLSHLLAVRGQKTGEERLVALADALERRADPALMEFAAEAAVLGGDPQRAITMIRGIGPRRGTPVQARVLTLALIEVGRLPLALRYLRYVVRRWPSLISLYVHWFCRMGFWQEAATLVDRLEIGLPEAQAADFRLLIAAAANDLNAALDAFERLKRAGPVGRSRHDMLVKLVYTRAHPAAIQVLDARLGPSPVPDLPLHRLGLAGDMRMEMRLESAALPSLSQDPTIVGWCLERPDSVMAAIRVIDCWHTAPGPAPPSEKTEPVPCHILQYWPSRYLPASLAARTQSWAGQSRWTHRRFDRATARQILRRDFGPFWLRAFNLARSPQDEEGLLRLCLLAREGGVWADPGTILHGDLEHLLVRTRGLLLYRDTMGGTLGTAFLASPPRHPVLVTAARLAAQALLCRSADSGWSKTGAGPLTRALGAHLVQQPATGALTLLAAAEVTRYVTIGVPIPDSAGSGRDPIMEALIAAL